jgi:branched-chain amino acid transport system ATP-binding protein
MTEWAFLAPILAGEDLHAYYGRRHVLRGVSFAIRRGETVVIRTLMGLVPSRSGRVLMDGLDVTGARTFALARRGIAYVPEGRGIFADLNVAENLAIAERPGADGEKRWSRSRALELF